MAKVVNPPDNKSDKSKVNQTIKYGKNQYGSFATVPKPSRKRRK